MVIPESHQYKCSDSERYQHALSLFSQLWSPPPKNFNSQKNNSVRFKGNHLKIPRKIVADVLSDIDFLLKISVELPRKAM
jgi:hypothetical protein